MEILVKNGRKRGRSAPRPWWGRPPARRAALRVLYVCMYIYIYICIYIYVYVCIYIYVYEFGLYVITDIVQYITTYCITLLWYNNVLMYTCLHYCTTYINHEAICIWHIIILLDYIVWCYTYIYIYTYIHIYMLLYICIYIYVHTCIYVFVYISYMQLCYDIAGRCCSPSPRRWTWGCRAPDGYNKVVWLSLVLVVVLLSLL